MSTLRSILREVCPRCRKGAIFAKPLWRGPLAVHPRCPECGLHFEREQGYFVGAIYINYAVTVAIAAGGVLVLDWTIGLTLTEELAIGIALGALVPLLFFRYARSLWLSLDYLLTVADERREQARLRARR